MRGRTILRWLTILGAVSWLAPACVLAVPGLSREPLTSAGIDAALAAAWPAGKIAPSGPSEDGTFLRRLYLDLVGVIPSMEEVVEFRKSADPSRREKLALRLIETPRFSERWGQLFRHLILGRKSQEMEELTRGMDRWLAGRIARHAGLDRIVRDVVAAEGTTVDNPAVAAILQFEDSREDTAGHFAKVFLGVQIQCAQCHDHPFEKWKRTDFYGLSAFFERTRRLSLPAELQPEVAGGKIHTADQIIQKMENVKEEDLKPTSVRYRSLQEAIDRLQILRQRAATDPVLPGSEAAAGAPPEMGMMMGGAVKPGAAKTVAVVFEIARGDISMPPVSGDAMPAASPEARKAALIAPRFLTGETFPLNELGVNRREILGSWMTAPENPFFARAMANRVWSILMGRGLVEPVDNVVNPDDKVYSGLLDRLAGYLVAERYDLRKLVMLIVGTQAYQRSSRPAVAAAAGELRFSCALVRPLDPEQIFSSVLEATGLEETFKSNQREQFESLRRSFIRQFVHHYQVDEPGEAMSFQGTIGAALFTLNGNAYNRSVRAAAGNIIGVLKTLGTTEERIRMLALRVLARDPSDYEKTAIAQYVDQKMRDPTWGQPSPKAVSPPSPSSSPKAVSPPSPKPTRSPAPKAPARAAKPNLEPMWRAYEDVLWAMLASTEFLNNH